MSLLTFARFVAESHPLTEGGAIFSSRRITTDEVGPTIRSLETLTGLSLADNTVGSTGITPTSGDLDMVVDATRMSKAQLIDLLKSKGADPRDIKNTGIEVSYRAPIYSAAGEMLPDHIQADFMFHKDPDYIKWFYGGVQSPPLKNVDKNVLLSVIAKVHGYVLSMSGLLDRETRTFMTFDRRKISQFLFQGKASDTDMQSIPRILALYKTQVSPEQYQSTVDQLERERGKSFR